MKRDDAARARDDAQEALDLAGLRFGLVAARFHRDIVDRLLEGAIAHLREHGVRPDDLQVVRVPGAWEVPLALDELAAADACDGLVALAVVIRGETPHFDYVCSGASRGCQDVSLRRRIPVGFGILTTDDVPQALARAGVGERSVGNKGAEAAAAAAEMSLLQRRVRGGEFGGGA